MYFKLKKIFLKIVNFIKVILTKARIAIMIVDFNIICLIPCASSKSFYDNVSSKKFGFIYNTRYI